MDRAADSDARVVHRVAHRVEDRAEDAAHRAVELRARDHGTARKVNHARDQLHIDLQDFVQTSNAHFANSKMHPKLPRLRSIHQRVCSNTHKVRRSMRFLLRGGAFVLRLRMLNAHAWPLKD